MSQINYQAPGKLFLAGEYAVTKSYQRALLVPVNRFLSVHLVPTSETQGTMNTNQIAQTITWEFSNRHVKYHEKAGQSFALIWALIEHVSEYAEKQLDNSITLQPFHLTIESELDATDGTKYGLGSSGALSVALTKALVHFYLGPEQAKDPLLIFKLIAVTHSDLNMLGSLGDVACQLLRTPVIYQNWNREWFSQQIKNHDNWIDLISKDWPGLQLIPVPWPKQWQLAVVWSQSASSTEKLLKSLQTKNQKQMKDFSHQFKTDSETTLLGIQSAIESQDWEAMKTHIANNYRQIKAYTNQQDKPYLTSTFITANNEIAMLDCVFKIAGAGAGDCAYALCQDDKTKDLVIKKWQEAHLTPLPLQLIL